MDNWETDPKTGKRFRRFGRNGIEYEMQVTTTAGTVPQSRLSETAQAEQDWRARMLRSESEERRSCPLREMRPCQADCVFYNGRICGIVSGSLGMTEEGHVLSGEPDGAAPDLLVSSIRSLRVFPEMNSSMTMSLPSSSQEAAITGIPATG